MYTAVKVGLYKAIPTTKLELAHTENVGWTRNSPVYTTLTSEATSYTTVNKGMYSYRAMLHNVYCIRRSCSRPRRYSRINEHIATLTARSTH